jgi:acetyltransferase
LSTAENVRAAALEILQSVSHYAPRARLDGISVQEMAPSGLEIVLGVKNDAQFGPLVAVGLGGIMVELLRDTAVRFAPVADAAARDMLTSLKGGPLLAGFRGKPGVDVDNLVDAICRLSELAHDLADVIDQIDINPVIASGATVMAADALIICR